MSCFRSFCALSILTVLSATAANWPAWRGPDGTGVSVEKNLPVRWNDKENVRWHVDLPGPGNSSPIVWGNRVFVSQAVENRRTLMCFDRANGKLLWQSGISYTENEPTQENNPYCAGTPATDGERVYVCFGSPGVYAYDFEGKELWHVDLGTLNHMFGTAVSPILYQNLCIVNHGPGEKPRLVALDKGTGKTVWEGEPPKVEASELQMPGGGGPGGRGGFGPGNMLATQILTQADKNQDSKINKNEFIALGDAWFDKLDTDKIGKLTQEQFVAKFNEVIPPPQGFGGPGARTPDGGGPGRPGGPGGGGGRGGPGRFMGPGLFTTLDSDKDGSLTRSELKGTFEKWAVDWDSEKTGALDEEKLRAGLNAALPAPNFGGFGGQGGPGGPGGRRGRGGPGGGAGPGGSWSTPVVVKADGHDELVVNFPARLVAYDPKSGKELWMSKGLGGTIYTTPVFRDGTVIATSSGMGGGSAIAVKAGARGEITESQRLWRQERVKSGMGSGVIHGDYLYNISQDGIATCLDLKSGSTVWEERLKGPGARSSSWSSMLLASDRIYVPNQSGDVFVLRAAPKFEVLATNSVNEPTNASLAAADRDLLFRTDRSLWCFAEKE